jgi:hypothetical protein
MFDLEDLNRAQSSSVFTNYCFEKMSRTSRMRWPCFMEAIIFLYAKRFQLLHIMERYEL